MNKSTKAQIKFLTDHPEIMARMFELNARGVSTYYLHDKLTKEYKHLPDAVNITAGTVRRGLHQYAPFHTKKMHSLVNPQHLIKVTKRFRNIQKRGSSLPYVGRPVQIKPHEFDLSEELKHLYAALEARTAYHEAIDNISKLSGKTKEEIDNWCDLTVNLFGYKK
jgi:hypothetical protein